MGMVAILQAQQMLGNRRSWPLAIFLALPVALSVLLRATDSLGPLSPAPPEAYKIYFFLLYVHAMCELGALLYASTLIAAELEGQTLGYLFTRPIRKWQVLCAKYAAVVAVLTPAVLASLLASWLVLGRPGGKDLLLGIGACSAAALAAWSAMFLLIGALIPSRAMVVGLLYTLVEFFLSFVPAVLNSASVTYYVRSLAVRLIGFDAPDEARRVLGDATAAHACWMLALMAAGGLAAACLVASTREYLAAKNE